MWGFQLWANLPASHKMMDPRYRGLVADEIPEATLKGDIRVKVICGGGGRGQGAGAGRCRRPRVPGRDDAGGDDLHPSGQARTHGLCLRRRRGRLFRPGAGRLRPRGGGDQLLRHEAASAPAAPENLILYGDGDEVAIDHPGRPVRFLLVSGKPIGEPVAWYGPIVMNTQDELRVAFEEYENGTSSSTSEGARHTHWLRLRSVVTASPS